MEPARTWPLTRGQFLRTAGGVAAAILASPGRSRAASPTPSHQTFVSRPDLRPPTVSVSPAPARGEGFAFLGPTSNGGAQSGAMIVDQAGQLIWFEPVASGRWVSNFRVQQYRNGPVLTWWAGEVDAASGYGRGSGVVLDSGYRQVAQIRAGNGRKADLHELLLTPEGTALLTCFPEVVSADLSHLGGPTRGRALESVIQEVDLATGRVVLEWRSLEHIPVSESYFPLGGVYDYLHVNSVDLTPDGHLLLSARHTCALYKVHRRSGRVMWRLGGKRSDFAMGTGTRFAWQHDARFHPGGRITLFDDGAGPRRTEAQSRGLTLVVDHRRRTVSLDSALQHPQPLLSYAMGSMQLLDDGDAIVGWGNLPTLSEFAPDGKLVFDLRLPWGHETYRAFRFPWSASPPGIPARAAGPASAGSIVLYASWNGATEVTAWQLSAGPSPSHLATTMTVPRTGFETAISLPVVSGYAAVTALGVYGQALGTSAAVQL